MLSESSSKGREFDSLSGPKRRSLYIVHVKYLIWKLSTQRVNFFSSRCPVRCLFYPFRIPNNGIIVLDSYDPLREWHPSQLIMKCVASSRLRANNPQWLSYLETKNRAKLPFPVQEKCSLFFVLHRFWITHFIFSFSRWTSIR